MLILRVVVCLSVFVTLGVGLTAGQATSTPADALGPALARIAADFDRTATAAVSNPNDIGYTLGVVTRDGLAWSKSYGFVDASRQTPASSDTVYGVGAGALTSVMLLQLLKSGVVHLSDAAATYVPELSGVRNPYPHAAAVTVLELATHTSGLALAEADVPAAASTVGSWESQLSALLPRATYAFEPGTHAELSPIEEGVLALALSRAARQPYGDYVKQHILQPLVMTHSTLDAGAGADQRGLGYRPALYTTIGDLAPLARLALLGGPDAVVPAGDVESNYRRTWIVNSIAVQNPSEGFGVGFEGETWTSNRLAHSYFILPIAYGGAGYDAALWFEPRTHAGVILLHHGGQSALGQLIHTYVYTLNAQPTDAGRQEPVAPFPYREDPVSVANTAAGVTLGGTLTIPAGTGPFPAVVLIARSGPFDRDETMLNHRPFLVLADALARQGVAVLRTDARGVGKSSGKLSGVREDAAADVDALLAYLRTRPEIDGNRIGVLGHSDGGLVASVVASRDSRVAYVVMLGTPAVSAARNIVEATRVSLVGNGELPERAAEQAARAGQGRPSDDPAALLKALRCPVLTLYGGKDLSVPASLNVPAMRSALAGNTHADVVEVPDVNLLFQTAVVGIGREANWAEETMAPSVMTRIGDWIGGTPHHDASRRRSTSVRTRWQLRHPY